MLHGIIERLRQKKRTVPYPKGAPVLPARFRGRPAIASALCRQATGVSISSGGTCAGRCSTVCPTGAIASTARGPRLDLGRCIFCGNCAAACPAGAISFSRDYQLAASRREDLFVVPGDGLSPVPSVTPLRGRLRSMFGRSLKLRQVSGAGCNACEADCNVLGTIVFDLPRFGIDFVASPRHADALLVTGPVPDNMRLALQKCYAAVAEPKLVIAVGSCAISGGLFRELGGHGQGLPAEFKPDLFIPGCPPHPYTIMDGLLRLLGRIG
ncbi:MAG: 4Fe-4S binding protein [Deltaproteobacteria bacterium]|jgi:Ni,Fe-hydrogenase III small subunit/formate hydrogenlyase subunit 6/NADH:ubiquinone oxidoreductase subunit I|nr:4Fe-4S binding protein [Deltaproteobacteria bacterium]